MNPWNVLGWILVAVVGLIAAIITLSILWGLSKVLGELLKQRWRYFRTRNTPVKKDQIWMQGDRTIRIGNQYENGNFVIHSGNASWGESPADWKKRVRNRKLYLLRDA